MHTQGVTLLHLLKVELQPQYKSNIQSVIFQPMIKIFKSIA